MKEDNLGVLHLVNNHHPQLEAHRHPPHFLRDRIARGEFRVVHVPSTLQHADFLTKPLHKDKVFRAPRLLS